MSDTVKDLAIRDLGRAITVESEGSTVKGVLGDFDHSVSIDTIRTYGGEKMARVLQGRATLHLGNIRIDVDINAPLTFDD